MNKKLFIPGLLVTIGFCFSVEAQTLFMPRGVAAAFSKGTHSLNGMPGGIYWQNHGRYTIEISAMPPDRTVRGSEQIVYYNNSPDSLRLLIIKLLLNVHKPGAPRSYGAQPDYLTDGVHIDTFLINGKPYPFPEGDRVFTNARIRLAKALAPHDSVQLRCQWNYQLSLLSGREGMIDSTTYFLAYAYPRVAVYDDYNGWDTSNFMDDHEFYSDFNDYSVTVRVPSNYLVWGTGTLKNPEEVLQAEYLQRYLASMKSDEVIHIATREEVSAGKVTAQNKVNVWRFEASDIPDVAFGISNQYVWDATSVVVDDATGRRAGAHAAYCDTAQDYHHVARFARYSLDWLSYNWPGVPYPYEKTTVFQGYAGMEYPMMANDESYSDTTFSRFVAEHEIAHTYMPFYMGINQTRYGFMDEGWATTFEYLIGTADLGKERADRFYQIFRVNRWIHDFDPSAQIPIITPGDALIGSALGNNEYGKASLGYLALKDMLGDELFRKCLHGFMDRWHGKHPIPWDFFYTVNDVSGRDLNWFWNNWFFSRSYIDFAVSAVNKSKGGYTVMVDNIGGYFAPADLVLKYADGSVETRHLGADLWRKNAKQAEVIFKTKKKVDQVTLDPGIFMDADESNNMMQL